jgi:N utilization substance protein A
MGAAREPGSRAKFAVASSDSDIDPVGACVGMKGSRVQNVVQELRGEKIDIIPWHVDAAKYVCNALAPADISRVIIDEQNRAMDVIVPDDSLSVAIGKRGQNVRLASKLTGWHLDVKSETVYDQDMKDGYDSLMSLPGMSAALADTLSEKGFYSADEVAESSMEELQQACDLSMEETEALIERAQTFVLNRQRAEAESTEEAFPEETSPVNDINDATEEEGSTLSNEDSEASNQGDGTPEPVT